MCVKRWQQISVHLVGLLKSLVITTCLSNLYTNNDTCHRWIALCFFGDDIVRLVDGGYRSIAKLKSGDRVWSIDEKGKMIEDEIVLMAHMEPYETGEDFLYLKVWLKFRSPIIFLWTWSIFSWVFFVKYDRHHNLCIWLELCWATFVGNCIVKVSLRIIKI